MTSLADLLLSGLSLDDARAQAAAGHRPQTLTVASDVSTAPAATTRPSPGLPAIIAARAERSRLLIYRYLLEVRPLDVLAGAVATTASPLHILLGQRPTPREVLAERARVDDLLAAPAPAGATDAHVVAALGLAAGDADALWLLATSEASPQILALVDCVLGFRSDAALPVVFLRHVTGARLDAACPLARFGLVTDTGRGHVRITPRARELLAGHAATIDAELAGIAELAAAPPLPPPVPFRAGSSALVLGPDGAGAGTIAAAIAGDGPVLAVDSAAVTSEDTIAAITREARLAGAVVLLRRAAAIAEWPVRLRAALANRASSIRLVLDAGSSPPAAVLELAARAGATHVVLEIPDAAARAALWRAALGEGTDAVAARLASLHVGADHIAHAVHLTRGRGASATALIETIEALTRPARGSAALRLGPLATTSSGSAHS